MVFASPQVAQPRAQRIFGSSWCSSCSRAAPLHLRISSVFCLHSTESPNTLLALLMERHLQRPTLSRACSQLPHKRTRTRLLLDVRTPLRCAENPDASTAASNRLRRHPAIAQSPNNSSLPRRVLSVRPEAGIDEPGEAPSGVVGISRRRAVAHRRRHVDHYSLSVAHDVHDLQCLRHHAPQLKRPGQPRLSTYPLTADPLGWKALRALMGMRCVCQRARGSRRAARLTHAGITMIPCTARR